MVEGQVYYEHELERLAASAWRGCKLSAPADLEAVCGRLKISLWKTWLGSEVGGLHIIHPKLRHGIIIVNSQLPPVRRRWNIAHEIGHHLLARMENPKPRSVTIMAEMHVDESERTERQCDFFASCLLMPAQQCIKWFGELADNRQKRVAVMAARFGVSVTAMRRRLQDLHLMDRRYEGTLKGDRRW